MSDVFCVICELPLVNNVCKRCTIHPHVSRTMHNILHGLLRIRSGWYVFFEKNTMLLQYSVWMRDVDGSPVPINKCTTDVNVLCHMEDDPAETMNMMLRLYMKDFETAPMTMHELGQSVERAFDKLYYTCPFTTIKK